MILIIPNNLQKGGGGGGGVRKKGFLQRGVWIFRKFWFWGQLNLHDFEIICPARVVCSHPSPTPTAPCIWACFLKVLFSWSREEGYYFTDVIPERVCIWASKWQNQQNHLWAQRWLRSVWASISLIRIFAICMKKYWVLIYQLSGQQRLIRLDRCQGCWSDWRMPRLIWVLAGHTEHFVGFVVLRLINIIKVTTKLSKMNG